MPEPVPLKPDWTIAPAAHLREWMELNEATPETMVARWAFAENRAEALRVITAVLAREPFGDETARILRCCTRISERMWLALEAGYRAGLAAGRKDMTGDD